MTIAIKVENLSKAYQIGQIGTGTISRDMERWWTTRVMGKEDPFLKVGETNNQAVKSESNIVWSLQDINLEIEQGDAVGIIGKNGAGKSTLLKLLSRVTSPTTGSIKIKGRVASLLEVGTGFHPELTGRENIFLNGSILGMRKKEIERKLDEIVDFSGVERYIDTPVKRYSSGMYVRLAFAVAAHLEPEILIVDEVLAVGDAQFQKKCLGKMKDISKRGGRTVLFVSHNMGSVASLCPNAILLDSGQIRIIGEARGVIDEYLNERGGNCSKVINLRELKRMSGVGNQLKLKSFEWLNDIPLRHGEPLSAVVSFVINEPVADATIGIGFSTVDGTRMLTYETDFQNSHRPSFREPKECSVRVEIDSLPLGPGIYSLDIGSRSGDFHALDYVPSAAQVEVIPGPSTPGNIVRRDSGVRLRSQWSWNY